MDHVELFERLALALAIGMLMGLERGWDMRESPDGHHAAGIRTFSLIGLLGGVIGWFSQSLGGLALLGGFMAMTALVVMGYLTRARVRPEVGFTTEVAELAAFALGALAAMGEGQAAAAGGVVATALLGSKDVLHGWVRRLERLELRAVIKLLVISVVLLPVLPNQGYGPGEVLNPYKLWLLVVLVAFISFLGYFAIKIAGPRIGSLLTGLFGGLASSTALTVAFSRMGKASPAMQPALAAGIAVANTTMYARLWAIVFALNHPIGLRLLPPLGAMAMAGLAGSWLLWRSRQEQGKPGPTALSNPFELGMAVKFAALLAVVMLASQSLQNWVGSAGLYLLAALAGLADVDAIALSMAQMGGHEVTVAVGATAIIIAAFVNTGVKVALVAGLCGWSMATRVAWVMLAVICCGSTALAAGWLGLYS